MASVHLGGLLIPGSPRNKGDLAVASLISLPDRVSPFFSFCEASLRVDIVRLYTYVHSKAVTCIVVKNIWSTYSQLVSVSSDSEIYAFHDTAWHIFVLSSFIVVLWRALLTNNAYKNSWYHVYWEYYLSFPSFSFSLFFSKNIQFIIPQNFI